MLAHTYLTLLHPLNFPPPEKLHRLQLAYLCINMQVHDHLISTEKSFPDNVGHSNAISEALQESLGPNKRDADGI